MPAGTRSSGMGDLLRSLRLGRREDGLHRLQAAPRRCRWLGTGGENPPERGQPGLSLCRIGGNQPGQGLDRAALVELQQHELLGEYPLQLWLADALARRLQLADGLQGSVATLVDTTLRPADVDQGADQSFRR